MLATAIFVLGLIIIFLAYTLFKLRDEYYNFEQKINKRLIDYEAFYSNTRDNLNRINKQLGTYSINHIYTELTSRLDRQNSELNKVSSEINAINNKLINFADKSETYDRFRKFYIELKELRKEFNHAKDDLEAADKQLDRLQRRFDGHIGGTKSGKVRSKRAKNA